MLQMIPNISRVKARNFVSNGAYSCPQKLLQAYLSVELTIEQKELLTQYMFNKTVNNNNNGINNGKADIKLSKQLYNMFMDFNPKGIISSDS